MMNIALLSIVPLRYFKEATTLTILALAKEYKKLGHNVVIITEKYDDLPEKQVIEGVTIYRLYKLGKILSFPFGLRKVQHELNLKFDIIHSFSASPLFVLSGFLSKLFSPKAKLVHTLKSYTRSKFVKYQYFLLNLANHVTVPTVSFASKLNLKKLHVIYSPINLEKFYPKNKNELKEKYGYSGKKVIFYYGSFHEHKGIDNLLKAAQHLDNVFFLLSPRYKEIPKERKLVQELGIQNKVKFLVDDIIIEDYVNLADVIVLPYNSMIATEGNPSCMLEAMACKTPVITSNLSELKEIANNLVYMTTPKDIQSIVENIKIAINNPNTQMINKAYEKSLEFGSLKIANKMLELYSQ